MEQKNEKEKLVSTTNLQKVVNDIYTSSGYKKRVLTLYCCPKDVYKPSKGYQVTKFIVPELEIFGIEEDELIDFQNKIENLIKPIRDNNSVCEWSLWGVLSVFSFCIPRIIQGRRSERSKRKVFDLVMSYNNKYFKKNGIEFIFEEMFEPVYIIRIQIKVL